MVVIVILFLCALVALLPAVALGLNWQVFSAWLTETFGQPLGSILLVLSTCCAIWLVLMVVGFFLRGGGRTIVIKHIRRN